MERTGATTANAIAKAGAVVQALAMRSGSGAANLLRVFQNSLVTMVTASVFISPISSSGKSLRGW